MEVVFALDTPVFVLKAPAVLNPVMEVQLSSGEVPSSGVGIEGGVCKS